MSRSGNVDTVIVKPANNVYTVLAFSSFLIVVGALIALYVKANALFPTSGLFDSK